MPENPRTKDFCDVYSNSLSMQFNDNDVRITFGHLIDVANPAKGMIEEVSVFMTPRTAKIMMLSLKRTIETFEQTSGAPIPMPPEKVEEIEKALIQGVVTKAAKPSI
jgi:phosphopantetheine adenylyltransferase